MADVRPNRMPSGVVRVRSDKGEIVCYYRNVSSVLAFAPSKSSLVRRVPKVNDVAERALGIIPNAALALRIQAFVKFSPRTSDLVRVPVN